MKFYFRGEVTVSCTAVVVAQDETAARKILAEYTVEHESMVRGDKHPRCWVVEEFDGDVSKIELVE